MVDSAVLQLRMVWPSGRRLDPSALRLPDGYVVCPADADTLPAFRALMAKVELGAWDDETFARVHQTVLPGGWRVILHEASGTLVATGMAQHRPVEDLYPDGYEVGWIAADPQHSGRGLGRVVTALATARLAEEEAARVYLQTDDFRLPALKTYLGLGFVPHLWAAGMAERWQVICARLDWPYRPQDWPRWTREPGPAAP
ncbi:GNAT family N-acetyltransferase [Actinopolymorpha pittospori]|uniref:Mycothiol synthase n=1 Tax=Actinopolymorpha pittospori TaxID=648752 RepID=A0A927MUX1_9ACTN|nr:GNAT family N-acetyltransferase [Actinopolymorpha pittospori]MBE1607355.1 mycothiol synthase [Actinopolymorpha pittospori]